MAGVDCCLQAMIILAILLFTAVHAQGESNKEEYLLASGKQNQGISSRRSPSMASELLVPVQSVVYRPLASREPFQTCGACRCCPKSKSNKSNCIQTQCCFAIKCNLPGKPYGVCSFSPQTCGCGANNCTHSPSTSLSEF